MRPTSPATLKGSPRARRVALLALAALLASACTRKNEDKPQPPPPARPAADMPVADNYWLEGKLPPSVMEGTPTEGGTLTVRIHAEPPHLSSHLLDPRDLVATRITVGKVYDTLMHVDTHDHPRYRMVPGAAESVEESPDHLTYTFKLRKGMKFHDGKPVTARDVEATVAKILDTSLPTAGSRSFFQDVKEQKAVDDLTYRVTLKQPYFNFVRQMGIDVPIYPKHLLEAPGVAFKDLPIHQAPVGSGPWKFVEWKRSQSITLARNDEYWGKKPHLDKLVFRIVTDHTVATQLFERGEFDVMTQIQHSVWVDMDRTPRAVKEFNRVRFFPNNYEWVGWNLSRPYFADPRVRRALALLFDHETFNRNVLQNLERPTACIYYVESDACDPGLKPMPYDPEQAKNLLKEAGWADHDGDGILDKDGVPFRFTFLMPATSVFLSKLTVYLRDTYKKVGIDMDISKAEWAVFSKRTHDREFDAASMLWGTPDSVIDPYQVWHSTQARDGDNLVGFQNPRADELMSKARVEFDEEKRTVLFRELGRIIYEEQPYLWLNVRPDLDAVRKTVHGIYPSLHFYNFDEVWLEQPAVATKQ